VNEPAAVLAKAGEIILELRLLKKDKGCVVGGCLHCIGMDGSMDESADSLMRTQTNTQHFTHRLEFAFLAVVDLVNSRSDLLLPGAGELHLATAAFGGAVSSAFEGLGETPVWRLQRDCSKEEGQGAGGSGGGACCANHTAALVEATHGGHDVDGDGSIGGWSALTTKMDLGE
jgi:hypothetical protein